MPNLLALLLLIALVITLGAGVGRVPLWPAVLVIVVALLLQHWPAR
jgi:membrane protein YqaA with SNARE-associated domain